ncbi:MAG: hypothetical protein ACLFT1_09700, partial [Desulfonatronovibrio sp.]
ATSINACGCWLEWNLYLKAVLLSIINLSPYASFLHGGRLTSSCELLFKKNAQNCTKSLIFPHYKNGLQERTR